MHKLEKKYWFRLYDSLDNYKRDLEVETDFGFTDSVNGGVGQISLRVAKRINDNVDFSDKIRIHVADRETEDTIVYSGYVSQIIPDQKNKSLLLICLGYASKFGTIYFRDGLDVLIDYTSTEVAQIIKDIAKRLSLNDPTIPDTFADDLSSIKQTGNTISYDANNLSISRALEKYRQYAPAFWFWNVTASDTIKFTNKFATKRHIFIKEKDLTDYRDVGKVEEMVNTVIVQNKQTTGFTGKFYTNNLSVTAYSRFTESIVDDRIRSVETADIRARTILEEKQQPVFEYSATVLDSNGARGGYDIEDIQVGDTALILDYDTDYSPATWDSTGANQKWSSTPVREWSSGGGETWGSGDWSGQRTGVYFWGQNTDKQTRRELIIAQKVYYPDRVKLVFQSRPFTTSRTIRDLKRGLDENKFDDTINSIIQ